MGELATIQNSTNSYVLALQSKKFCDQKKGECVDQLIEIIAKVYFDCGQKIEGKDLNVLSTNLHTEIAAYFKFIRTDEIKIAFANGVRGEYGEWFGLNIKTFHGWMKQYQLSESRKAAIQALQAPLKIEPTDEEKKQIERDYWKSLLGFFKRFKRDGRLDFHMPLNLYNDLEAKGLIDLSEIEIERIRNRARGAVIKQLGETIDKRKRQILKRFNEHTETEKDLELVWAKCYEIAIEDYWNSLTEEQWENIITKIIATV